MSRRPAVTSKHSPVAVWWVTLGAGLVVALVVWALLEMLRRAVLDVESSVSDVWTAGKRLAQNTQAAHALDATRGSGGELADEVERLGEKVRKGKP